MEPLPFRKTVQIGVSSIAVDGLGAIACPNCGGTVDVMQPDPNLPDLFLATCPECPSWFLVGCPGDGDAATVVSLEPLLRLIGDSQSDTRARMA